VLARSPYLLCPDEPFYIQPDESKILPKSPDFPRGFPDFNGKQRSYTAPRARFLCNLTIAPREGLGAYMSL
jgi:hypothetical protein